MFTNQRYNYGFHRNWASLLSFTAIYLPDAHFDFLTKLAPTVKWSASYE